MMCCLCGETHADTESECALTLRYEIILLGNAEVMLPSHHLEVDCVVAPFPFLRRQRGQHDPAVWARRSQFGLCQYGRALPARLAFDRSGNLYVANLSYNNITRFTAEQARKAWRSIVTGIFTRQTSITTRSRDSR